MKAESQLYFQKSQKLKAEAKFFKVISFSQKPKLNHLAAKHCIQLQNTGRHDKGHHFAYVGRQRALRPVNSYNTVHQQ